MKLKEETIDKQKAKQKKLSNNLKANLQRRKEQKAKSSNNKGSKGS